MKVLEVDATSAIGGGTRVVYDIVDALLGEYDIQVASPAGHYSIKYQKRGIVFHELRGNMPILSIRRLIQRERPDILHVHGTRAAFWARAAVIGLRKKPYMVYTLHGLHIIRRGRLERNILLTLERFLNRWTDRLVCVSESDRTLVLEHKTIRSDKIVLIHNGIDLEDYYVSPEEAASVKAELNLESRFVLCAIGRLHPPKDFSTVLRALKILVSKDTRFFLLIVGDGPLRIGLEEEVRKLCLVEYVRFLGFREDIAALITASDVVILSSRWEALGLVCLEAGACRRPVVASDIGGIRDAVVDGKTGLLFREGSPEDLAKKITVLASSEKLRRDMGEAGHTFVSERYSKRGMAEGYRGVYESARARE